MEQRLANACNMTVNEKRFIETSLFSDLRVDGRRPFDYRELKIKLGREYGSSEVQLGQTHVMGFVTAQLVQPYKDRQLEGSLAIYIEFSPMADPSFEIGRPGESAVELGCIIDRGLRESRAVDTESLCVLAGKLVWSIRIDLHILDNGGNLVDAANIAALASLMTFRRPECSFCGENEQEIIVHPPEVQEPLPLILHHLPIAVTFAFITDNNIVVVDPTYSEEAIMKGTLTAAMNENGDVCAIQKAGRVGVSQKVVMQCLRIAAAKAADITSKIKDAVDSYNKERALCTINHVSSFAALDVSTSHPRMTEDNSHCEKRASRHQIWNSESQEHGISKSNNMETDEPSSKGRIDARDSEAKSSIRGPSCWDPYSKGVDADFLKASLSCCGKWKPTTTISDEDKLIGGRSPAEGKNGEVVQKKSPWPLSADVGDLVLSTNRNRTLKDAVKPKDKRKKGSSAAKKKLDGPVL